MGSSVGRWPHHVHLSCMGQTNSLGHTWRLAALQLSGGKNIIFNSPGDFPRELVTSTGTLPLQDHLRNKYCENKESVVYGFTCPRENGRVIHQWPWLTYPVTSRVGLPSSPPLEWLLGRIPRRDLPLLRVAVPTDLLHNPQWVKHWAKIWG